MTTLRETLEASGRLGRDLLAVDWAATPLGEPESWPNSLQTAVRILVSSRFSMWMAWGPELTFFCNDAYRRDTLGRKYPWALGRPASQVWSEVWPEVSPRIDRVITTGEATWDENLLLFLERSDFVEETYHTFSYSPLPDDDGRVAGMLCVVKEDTEQVISARRMATLRDLGTRSSGELTEAETIASACQHLAANPRSLPFTAVYLFDDEGTTARRAGMAGFAGDHPAAPRRIAATDESPPWPVRALLQGETVVVADLAERFDDLPHGEWDVPPSHAAVAPLAQPTDPRPYGFIVAGLNPLRPLDEAFLGFVQLVAGHIAAAITDARAYEFERRRAESLARIDQAKTDFFTNVSHEFRTPLTLLLGPVDDALADTAEPLAPAQRRRLQVVQRNGERLLKLVNSLLDFSRLESGKVTPRFEPVDLARSTSELTALFQSAVESAGLELVVTCPPLPDVVYVDPDQWAKIVLNLLSNALKFTFDGRITVTLGAAEGDAVLTVSDTGSGIPEEEMERLFERFHRVHGAQARTHEGSGIGLALVAELAALHGGTVSAQSRVGEGSSFTVRVPFGTAHLPADQVVTEHHDGIGHRQARGFVAEAFRWLEAGSAEPVASDQTATAPSREQATVLVVDDNPDMRDYVSDLLSTEYDVQTAADGSDDAQPRRVRAAAEAAGRSRDDGDPGGDAVGPRRRGGHRRGARGRRRRLPGQAVLRSRAARACARQHRARPAAAGARRPRAQPEPARPGRASRQGRELGGRPVHRDHPGLRGVPAVARAQPGGARPTRVPTCGRGADPPRRQRRGDRRPGRSRSR
jgi:signal transduction histidine kinase